MTAGCRRHERSLRPAAADVPAMDAGVASEKVDAFLAASRTGDFEKLLAVLDPNGTPKRSCIPKSK
jgi:hypothetical protein